MSRHRCGWSRVWLCAAIAPWPPPHFLGATVLIHIYVLHNPSASFKLSVLGYGSSSLPASQRQVAIDITPSNAVLGRREQLPRFNSLQKTFQHLSHISAPVSLPETVAGSPPKTNPLVDITAIVTQLQPILDFRENECEINGITPAVLRLCRPIWLQARKQEHGRVYGRLSQNWFPPW